MERLYAPEVPEGMPYTLEALELPLEQLSGSHRSTHIVSDLASRALASQAKPQRESELLYSRAFRIAILKNTLICRIAGQYRRIFAGIFLAFPVT